MTSFLLLNRISIIGHYALNTNLQKLFLLAPFFNENYNITFSYFLAKELKGSLAS